MKSGKEKITSFKEILENARKEVENSPSWLKEIYKRNQETEKYLRENKLYPFHEIKQEQDGH